MRWITSGDRVSHIYSELQVHLKVSLAHNLLKSDIQLLGSYIDSYLAYCQYLLSI